MLPALLAIEPEKVFALPDHSLADNDFKLMATLSDLADRELVATIGWAKQVPGKLICLCCLSFDSYEVYRILDQWRWRADSKDSDTPSHLGISVDTEKVKPNISASFHRKGHLAH